MSVSYIPEKTKIILWGLSAGRCQYVGCNKPLYLDSLTKAKFNQAYIAHIVADKPDGPRGDIVLSPLLDKDIKNLMLLCDSHHRLVDKEDVIGHTVDRLLHMKKLHEDRINLVTSISKNMEAHIILYGANIGSHSSPLRINEISAAFEGKYYPSNEAGFELGLGNSLYKDHEIDYWKFESENLKRQFKEKIIPLIESSKTANYCVFGLAPQPLLIELGTLLHDLKNVEVFNLQKEPKNWKWQEIDYANEFLYKPAPQLKTNIALVFSLSGQISDERIITTLGEDTSIYTITLKSPNNDFLKTEERLKTFRVLVRQVFDDIKIKHGETSRINIFPAMLPGAAIEVGRVWYPKADLPLTVYDQNKQGGGFIKTIEIE